MRRIPGFVIVVVSLLIASISTSAAQSAGGAFSNLPNIIIIEPDEPTGGVGQQVRDTVPPGFASSSSGESECDWELAVSDDSAEVVYPYTDWTNYEEADRSNALPGIYDPNVTSLPEGEADFTTERHYSATGRWWSRNCPSENDGFVTASLIPEGEAVTLEGLLLESLAFLDPPEPGFTLLPEDKQLVQFKSVFWIEPVYWDLERADTRSVGRVSSTLDLVPSESVWDPGDGSGPVVCDGPGEIYERGMDNEDFDCGYRYTTVVGQPFTFSTTVMFDIQVTATIGGAPAPEVLGPYEPLERTAVVEVGAREIQVVESNG